MSRSPISVFLSYVPQDELALGALETQLKPLQRAGEIATWNACALRPGEDTAATIGARLASADVVLLLVSADYLASDSAMSEMAAALRKREAEGATIVPVIRTSHGSASHARCARLPRRGPKENRARSQHHRCRARRSSWGATRRPATS